MVSIIIPAYKARNFLAQSLDSVAAQSHQDWEILVIDDCSPERVDDIIDDFNHRTGHPVRLIRHESNQGLGAARNTGIRAADGEWIAFLDHDDVWRENHLQALVTACDQGTTDIAFSTVQQFRDHPSETIGTWGPDPADMGDAMPLALFDKSFITPSATLVRKTLLLEVGGFDTDPRVHMCEDLDLWLRLLKLGARFEHIPEPSCFYRKHPESATGRPASMAYQAALVREKHIRQIPGPFHQKCSLVARRWWDAHRVLMGVDARSTHALIHALLWSLPVPWEIGRGLIRLRRIKLLAKLNDPKSHRA